MSDRRRRDERTEIYNTCRTLRHAWEPISPGDRRPKFGTLACLRCWRCGMIRYDKFSRLTGDRIGSLSYVQPEGYKDSERHSMAWYRALWAEDMYDKGLIVDAPDAP